MNRLIFLLVAIVCVSITIVDICNAPIINGLVGYDNDGDWKKLNCKKISDEKDDKDLSTEDKDELNKNLNRCNRKKAMYGLEFASLIMDVVLGFICALLGLLNYFGSAKGLEKVIGLIGIISGAVCFVMTLVYVCYSGYIFNNDDSEQDKLNEDGAIMQLNEAKTDYEKIFKEEDSMAKFKDLGKKQYNYNKDLYFDSTKSNSCLEYKYEEANRDISQNPNALLNLIKACPFLYKRPEENNVNKYMYDRWLTSIILSVLVCALNIGHAVFGFLIFKNSDSSSGHIPVK